MKSIYFNFLFLITLCFYACSKDGDDQLCLSCDIIGESFETVCVGEVDSETGETFSRVELELIKGLTEAFGATCTLE